MSKKSLHIEDFNNFIIIQTAFLGDIALSLYLVQAIKDTHPNSIISFITTKEGAEIAKLAKCIDKVVVFDKRGEHRTNKALKLFAKQFNSKKDTCIISLHKSFRTSKLVSKIKAKVKIGFNVASFSWLVYNYTQYYHIALNEYQRNLSLLRVFGLNLVDKEIKVQIEFSENSIAKINNLLFEKGFKNKFIVLAPGSVWATKRWLPEYFAELINKLNAVEINCIIIGGKSDLEINNEVFEKIEDKTKTMNITGMTSIEESIYLISKSQFVITNDSAPTHFSELVNVPTITIYGPTSPIFGFAPKMSNSMTIENNELTCRPCQIHGSNRCPLNTLECMKSLTPQIVFEQIEKNYLHINK